MGKEAVRDLKKETRHRETEREWKKEGLHKMKEELTAGMNKQNINKGIGRKNWTDVGVERWWSHRRMIKTRWPHWISKMPIYLFLSVEL